jgi:hypothetical protein
MLCVGLSYARTGEYMPVTYKIYKINGETAGHLSREGI